MQLSSNEGNIFAKKELKRLKPLQISPLFQERQTMKFVSLFLLIISPFGSFAETNLEATVLGALARRGDVENYRSTWNEIIQLPFEERQKKVSEVLKAKDSQGNNIFHLMSQHESLAGDMLHLAVVVIEYFEVRDLIDDWNRKGLTPRETALKAGNSLGAEYLVSMENRIKKLRGDVLQPDFDPDGSIVRLPPHLESELTEKKALLGAIVLAHGLIDMTFGTSLNNIIIFSMGGAELFLGGTACYEAFQTWRHKMNLRP